MTAAISLKNAAISLKTAAMRLMTAAIGLTTAAGGLVNPVSSLVTATGSRMTAATGLISASIGLIAAQPRLRATPPFSRPYTARTPTLRFYRFAIDCTRHVLTCDGERVRLSVRLVKILAHLASHPGEIITKQELLDRFWPNLHVEENTVGRAMTRLRVAVNDNPANPTIIQTVPGEGYRFIAPVDTADVPTQPDALDEWSNGRLSLEGLDAGQLQRATAAFERVLAKNSHLAAAHAAVANGYFLQYERTRPHNLPNRELFECAMHHARRATTIDQKLSEAWATLALLLMIAGKPEAAQTAAWRAVLQQPGNWRHEFRLAVASWGQPRLDAVYRTHRLLRDFGPAYLLAAMVWVARGAFAQAEELAANGAAIQSQDAERNSPFPAFGLHWLLGLLSLRKNAIDEALASFEREMTGTRRTNLYYEEYCANALIGAGYAHLAAGDPRAATAAFNRTLEILPANGPALLGLQHACLRSGAKSEADALARRVDESAAEMLKGGRYASAALLTASAHAARGNAPAACDMLERLLSDRIPTQVGWSIPIDPAFAAIHGDSRFESLCRLLTARAA